MGEQDCDVTVIEHEGHIISLSLCNGHQHVSKDVVCVLVRRSQLFHCLFPFSHVPPEALTPLPSPALVVRIGTRVIKDRDGRPAVRDPTFLAETQIMSKGDADRILIK